VLNFAVQTVGAGYSARDSSLKSRHTESYMCPSVLDQNLHLIDQAMSARLFTCRTAWSRRVLGSPRTQPPTDYGVFKQLSRPGLYSKQSVLPRAPDLLHRARPRCTCELHHAVCVSIIAHPDLRIHPNSLFSAQRVIGVNQATLRPFEMIFCKAVWNASES
jgi:hypothetical protein